MRVLNEHIHDGRTAHCGLALAARAHTAARRDRRDIDTKGRHTRDLQPARCDRGVRADREHLLCVRMGILPDERIGILNDDVGGHSYAYTGLFPDAATARDILVCYSVARLKVNASQRREVCLLADGCLGVHNQHIDAR